MPINRVKKAIEEIKKGRMVIMIDDEDRENEGDLVYGATFSSPELVNFMATHAKGLICVAVNQEIAKRLNLYPMVSNNDSQHETAFTISVDAKGATTGISAYERDMTIKLLASYNSVSEDFVRPGHIFPLVAKEGGVLVRTGHTEGSVDLCKLAGISESAVICEIMKENGEMARRDDLDIFAKKFGLHIVFISDIVEYRLRNESLIRVISESKKKFLGIDSKRIDFIDHLGRHHIAYLFGDIKEETNVKFHNIGLDIELLAKARKYNFFMNSIEYLKNNGGVLIFLESDKSSDKIREFGIGAQILNKIGVKEINLITNSRRQKEFIGISGFNLTIKREIVLDY